MPRSPSRLVIALFALIASHGRADVAGATEALRKGDYGSAAAQAQSEAGPRAAEITLRALLATGQYSEAADLARRLLAGGILDAPVLLAAHDALISIGEGSAATNALMIAARTQRDAYDPQRESPAAAAARAQALQLLGADPRLVLERILSAAIEKSPDAREPYLALAGIALVKQDRLLAAETLRKALPKFPDDADVRFGMARALSDPKEVDRYLADTLERNPHHVAALVFQADRLTDAGDFAAARKSLEKALAINPASPEAWAQQAIVAQLEGDMDEAEQARGKALAPWPQNPEVDYLIGASLGRHYRFEEAINALRSALAMDSTHLPSHFELGSNLLRSGREAQGWDHIERVQARDPYHVAAYNLMTLKLAMANMTSLHRDGVELRLTRRDRDILGAKAMALSVKAKDTFVEKYDTRLPFDVTVDMLPTQKDFAVRTFSLPIGEGFLGVCFGRLITTCSPGERLGRANWEAILWHEMAHTITLTASRHRIPRWLSEGMSVHEENLVNSGWGMWMNSDRRKIILEDELPPLAQLDSLFRKNIDLAYFYSSLAAEYLDQKIGTPGMQRVLRELAADRSITEALTTVAGPMDALQAGFEKFAKERAESYGRGLDWTPLTDEEFQSLRADPQEFLQRQPARYFAAMDRAQQLAIAGDWQGVRSTLEPILALEPANREKPSPYELLARAKRELGDAPAEIATLQTILALDANAQSAAERLLELSAKNHDAALADRAAQAVLAIDPYHVDALIALERAQLKAGNLAEATATCEALVTLRPIQSARLHYELAVALHEHRDPAARRRLLLALEKSPRHEAALDLLQTMNGGKSR